MILMNTLPPPPVSLISRNLSAGLPVVAPEGNPSVTYQVAKRLLDIVGSLALILVLSPLLLTLLIVLTITTRGKPLFWQRRAGHLGKTFMMAKFRTMRLDADKIKHTVANESTGPVFKNRRDPRITPAGPHPAEDEPRRDAAVVPRALRADVAGRPASAGRSRSGPFRSLAASPPGGEAGADVPLAGQRPQRHRLRGMVADGPLVRAEPEPQNGHRASLADADVRAGLQGRVLTGGISERALAQHGRERRPAIVSDVLNHV